MVIRPSRHKPQVGDLFVLNMLGKRWIAGRVIRTDADALVPNSDLLLYFYRVEPTGPDNIATPIKPDLLIPPILSSALGWRRGYYMHIRNNPLQAQELLPRHVFEDNLFPKTLSQNMISKLEASVPEEGGVEVDEGEIVVGVLGPAHQDGAAAVPP